MTEEGDEFGEKGVDIANRFYAGNNHFAIVKNSNVSRMPFANQGSGKEFSLVEHC